MFLAKEMFPYEVGFNVDELLIYRRGAFKCTAAMRSVYGLLLLLLIIIIIVETT